MRRKSIICIYIYDAHGKPRFFGIADGVSCAALHIADCADNKRGMIHHKFVPDKVAVGKIIVCKKDHLIAAMLYKVVMPKIRTLEMLYFRPEDRKSVV